MPLVPGAAASEQQLERGRRDVAAHQLKMRVHDAGPGRAEEVSVHREKARGGLLHGQPSHELDARPERVADGVGRELAERNVMARTDASHGMNLGHGEEVRKEHGLAPLDPAARQQLLRIARRGLLPPIAADEAARLAVTRQPLDQRDVGRAEEHRHLVLEPRVPHALVAGQRIAAQLELLRVELPAFHRIVEGRRLRVPFELDRALHALASLSIHWPRCQPPPAERAPLAAPPIGTKHRPP
jgi:hypothetical protein